MIDDPGTGAHARKQYVLRECQRYRRAVRLVGQQKTRLRTDGVGRKFSEISRALACFTTSLATAPLAESCDTRTSFDTDSLDSMLGAPATALHPANPGQRVRSKECAKGVVRKVKT